MHTVRACETSIRDEHARRVESCCIPQHRYTLSTPPATPTRKSKRAHLAPVLRRLLLDCTTGCDALGNRLLMLLASLAKILDLLLALLLGLAILGQLLQPLCFESLPRPVALERPQQPVTATHDSNP